jgi:hypothetical protein
LQAHCRRDAGIRGARVGQQRAPRLGQKTNRRAYEEALAKGPGGRGKTSALAAARQGCRPSRTRPPAARSGLPPCRAQLVRHGSSPVHHPALVDAKLHLAEAAKVSALEDLLEPLMEGGHKVLVFSQFVTMLDLLREAVNKHEWPHFCLAGATDNRGKLVETFQSAEGQELRAMSLRALRTATNISSLRLTNVKNISASAM